MAQLGFVVTTSPHGGTGARAFYLLAAAALNKGYQVKAFFCEEGVYHCLASSTPSSGSEYGSADYLRSFLNKGAEIVVSSHCLRMRGIAPEQLCGVQYGTFDALRRMAGEVDRMVCL